jgi:transposase
MPRKPSKNRRGRPTKYSPAVARKICKAVAGGCSREAAANLSGVSASALYEWQRQNPDFAESLARADAQFEKSSIAAIRRAGRQARNWPANAWLLERKFPQRYARVDRHLIQSQSEIKVLPDEYIKAITHALGLTGNFKPIEVEGGIELPVLTDGENEMIDDLFDKTILPA